MIDSLPQLKRLTHEESAALEWIAPYITEAEIVAKNPKAIRNPQAYAHDLAMKYWKDERLLPLVVEEWKRAARERKLDEPLWPGTPRLTIQHALGVAA